MYNIEILMTKDLITQQEVDRFLKRLSDNNIDKSNQEQILKLLQEIRIILDEGLFEDSIDGTRIRIKYDMEIGREKRGEKQAQTEEKKEEEQGGENNTVGFQYVREIPI